MSNFFDKSDLVRKDAENIVSDTLKNCDDGELYLEDSKSESIVLDDNKVLNKEGLRFTDEFVRHKVLDFLGDISLSGKRILG